ncbi:unnamed protein product [Wuchereria bancrofti]|uniref:Uncharacterized protein n=1 Tax=Wuchereria bancrofti TaxID=6293 RepID=A0A3P7EAN6_WUCBA|nr:unnamed protein product [Wuchereria bancrofti]
MRLSKSEIFHPNEHDEIKSKIIVAPKAITHYEHLPKPLSRTRSAFQISLQSSVPSTSSSSSTTTTTSSSISSSTTTTTSSSISSSTLAVSSVAEMYSTIQKRIPFKKNMENMRNVYDIEHNEQFKYYPDQSKNTNMISTFSCPQKFFNRHVKRQASFLAAVSANNSHRCKGDKNTYKIGLYHCFKIYKSFPNLLCSFIS